jgi:hypothetical protein
MACLGLLVAIKAGVGVTGADRRLDAIFASWRGEVATAADARRGLERCAAAAAAFSLESRRISGVFSGPLGEAVLPIC